MRTAVLDAEISNVLMKPSQRISDVVQRWSESSPDQLAVVEGCGSWTYRQLENTIAQTRDWLAVVGVRSGDRVMMVCENSHAFAAVRWPWPSLTPGPYW